MTSLATLSMVDVVDQQLWCFGQDIQHPEGNLLLRWGCSRERVPAATGGSSRYTHSSADFTCILWGFAMAAQVSNGQWLLLRRHPFRCTAVNASLDDVFRPEALPIGSFVDLEESGGRYAATIARLAASLAVYEQFVASEAGSGWRHQCELRRPRAVRRHLSLTAADLATYWSTLAQRQVWRP